MTKKALDHLISAWKSARQALLAVATVLAYGMVFVGSVYAQTSPPQPQAIDEPAIARAVELFLANRQYEALQALAPETLALTSLTGQPIKEIDAPTMVTNFLGM